MNAKLLLMLAALLAAAGCNGASSAREADSEAAATTRAASGETPAQQPGARATANSPKRDSAGIVETSFDDLKFPMEKTEDFVESMLTDRVKSLFDERIRIRGYMYPTFRSRGLKQFVLVRDNLECCFGPGAALFDCVLVNMQAGKTAEFETRPIAVEGEFRFEPLPGPEGRPVALFQMTGEAVR